MSVFLQSEPVVSISPDWPVFEIPVHLILNYVSEKTGNPEFPPGLWESLPVASETFGDWQAAVAKGQLQPLHLNLGTPGVEIPEHPVEENAITLVAAILFGWESIQVILSGELEIAVEEGLITEPSLQRLQDSFREFL